MGHEVLKCGAFYGAFDHVGRFYCSAFDIFCNELWYVLSDRDLRDGVVSLSFVLMKPFRIEGMTMGVRGVARGIQRTTIKRVAIL